MSENSTHIIQIEFASFELNLHTDAGERHRRNTKRQKQQSSQFIFPAKLLTHTKKANISFHFIMMAFSFYFLCVFSDVLFALQPLGKRLCKLMQTRAHTLSCTPNTVVLYLFVAFCNVICWSDLIRLALSQPQRAKRMRMHNTKQCQVVYSLIFILSIGIVCISRPPSHSPTLSSSCMHLLAIVFSQSHIFRTEWQLCGAR